MSYLFGSAATMSADFAERRKLLIKASTPERWSSLLQSVTSDWDITWALDDEQFSLELSEGKFAVAAFDITHGNGINSALFRPAALDPNEETEFHSVNLSTSRSNRPPLTQFLLLQGEEHSFHEQVGDPALDLPLLAEIRDISAAATPGKSTFARSRKLRPN
jgi:hypothetical protein